MTSLRWPPGLEWLLLAVSIVAQAAFVHTRGTSDVLNLIAWINDCRTLSLSSTYHISELLYPPGAMAILWCAARLLPMEPLSVVKVLEYVFLFASAGVVLAWTRRPALAALTIGALMIGSTALMYLDIFGIAFLIASFCAFARRRPLLGIGLYTIACLIKWQPLIVGPFVLWHAATSVPPADRLRVMGRATAMLAAVAAILLVAFGSDPVHALFNATTHDHLSAQGANVGWIIAWLWESVHPERYGAIADGPVAIIHSRIGGILMKAGAIAVYAGVFRAYLSTRTGEPVVTARYALLGYLTYCVLSSGVHENHAQVAVGISLALAAMDHRSWKIAAWLGVAVNLNMLEFYGVTGLEVQWPALFHIPASVWIAAANIGVAGWIALRTLRSSGAIPVY